MNKKYQVFISSTYDDLKEVRKSIIDILLSADCIPAGMEAFSATDDEQFNVIKKVIDLCDYYILILGNRYGSVNEETGKSYTQMEYEYAKEKGIPVLVFSLDSPSFPSDEDLEKDKKLKAFKVVAMQNRLASIWTDMTTLGPKVAVSIMKIKTEQPQTGWIRDPGYDELSLLKANRQLQTQLDEITERYEKLAKSWEEANKTSDLAFDKETVVIPFHYYPYKRYDGQIRSSSLEITWAELFKSIAIRMLNVTALAKTIETYVEDLIAYDTSFKAIYLDDKKFINLMLNQFEHLHLVTHSSAGDKGPFYQLTSLGKRKLNEMTLVRKSTSSTLD